MRRLTRSKIPADKPTLRTISSTRLLYISNEFCKRNTVISYPLQLIKVPIVVASLHPKPENLAAALQAPNFPT